MNSFSNPENLKSISAFCKKLDNNVGKTEFETTRNSHVKNVFSSIVASPRMWDENTSVTSGVIGDYFFKQIEYGESEFTLNPTDVINDDILDEIFVILFRYCLEFYISDPNSSGFNISEIRNFAIENQSKFLHSKDIRYALNVLPIEILKNIIGSGDFKSLSEFTKILKTSKSSVDLAVADSKDHVGKIAYEFDEKIKSVEQLINEKDNEWKSYLDEKKLDVDKLEKSLASYKNAFNFVGLYDGFKELSDEKTKEKTKALILVSLLAFVALFPLGYESYHLSSNKTSYVSLTDYLSLIPMFSITVILIYYFKIALQNYNSIKAQLAQIELRKTLCRFIQDYGDYSVKMKKQDPESLSKFENIIFSSIITNGDNIPATFDGLEQIAKIIGNLKSSK
ncbi:TPA: hypothetical protein PXQ51_001417 [Yersinia enterocolitica]|nr:hypothetical protein [Yersinia enterocolitica]EKN4871909.1 hypothetical protein [Yersinia enterocolitica]EKN6127328.1 hypothetical protein [Yersinia enterocolitica]CQH62921.1 Uncharacterised protein [Yersinia enterocolitica]HDL8065479.1 hypothetical protein [Yersinia enterocolitica]